jgi:hypothetical protein
MKRILQWYDVPKDTQLLSICGALFSYLFSTLNYNLNSYFPNSYFRVMWMRLTWKNSQRKLQVQQQLKPKHRKNYLPSGSAGSSVVGQLFLIHYCS